MVDELKDRTEPELTGDGSAEAPIEIASGPFGSRPVIKKRRSRKERQDDLAQPDEFVEVGGTIVDWLVDQGKAVLIVVAVLLVALVVTGTSRWVNSNKRTEASSELFKAKQQLPTRAMSALGGGMSLDLSGSDDSAEDKRSKTEESVNKLELVAQNFSGTPQAGQAQVIAAQALYDIGEYERALVFLDVAAKDKRIAGERAKNLRGFTLIALDRAAEAVTVFSELRDKTSGGSRAYATMHLGAAHEAAGDMEKARGVYQLFEVEFPDSDLLSEVQARAGANAAP